MSTELAASFKHVCGVAPVAPAGSSGGERWLTHAVETAAAANGVGARVMLLLGVLDGEAFVMIAPATGRGTGDGGGNVTWSLTIDVSFVCVVPCDNNARGEG